jgi:AraC-like DNA-binding protein
MPKLDLHHVEVWKAHAPACRYSSRNLAAKAGVSRCHLTRCSQYLFHASPQKVYDTIRLLAAPDVIERELSVKVAAEKLGFKQQSQFSRDFKAFYGICPKRYLALPISKRVALKVRVHSRVRLTATLDMSLESGQRTEMSTTDTK